MDYARLLLGQKFATRYQIGLFKLIQEYYIVKKRGKEFGKIAIERGFATQLDVQKAREFAARVTEKGLASEREVAIAQRVQEEEFEKENRLKILGDVMVTMGFITEEQKAIILKDQIRSREPTTKETKSKETKSKEPPGLEVIISPDKITAWAKINRHFLSQATVPRLKSILIAHGITNGIYPDALLQGQLKRGNLEFTAARSDVSSKLMKAKNLKFYMETNLTEGRSTGKTGDDPKPLDRKRYFWQRHETRMQ